jgi:predicted P-loop ATPase/GTPase
VFVFGLFSHSPGKTVASSALARGLLNDGFNVGVFKPRSGHSMWHQYEAFLKCRAEGRLFCEDIMKLKEASRCPLPYEVLNPIDALMSPLKVEKFLR